MPLKSLGQCPAHSKCQIKLDIVVSVIVINHSLTKSSVINPLYLKSVLSSFSLKMLSAVSIPCFLCPVPLENQVAQGICLSFVSEVWKSCCLSGDRSSIRKKAVPRLAPSGQKWGSQKMHGSLQSTLSLQSLGGRNLKEAHQEKPVWKKAFFLASSPGISPNRWLLTNLHPGNAIIALSICPAPCLHKYTVFSVWPGRMMLRL